MLDLLATLLGGILLILCGLGLTFYGYGVFRLLLPVVGFLAGLLLGRAIFPDQPVWGWIVGLGIAAVLAILSYVWWSFSVTLSGAVLGFTLGTSLMHMLGLWNWLSVLVGLAVAVVFGVAYFYFRDYFVMAATGLAGASLLLYGVAVVLPWFEFLKDRGNWLTFILSLVIGLLGAAVQVLYFRGMSYYDSPEPGQAPPPILITRSNPT